LSGVSTKYGRNSNEYRKAGGSLRKSKTVVAQSALPMTLMTSAVAQPAALETVVSTNGKGIVASKV
jgi:hypothetical protein